MSDAPELKPCPFCGGEAEFHSLLPRYDDAFVCCPNCEIDGPRFGGNDDREGSNAQAIAAWNTRAALREIEELEARLAKAVEAFDCWHRMMDNPAYDLGEMVSEFDAIVSTTLAELNREDQ